MNIQPDVHTRDKSRAYYPAPVETGFSTCSAGFRFCGNKWATGVLICQRTQGFSLKASAKPGRRGRLPFLLCRPSRA